MWTLKTRYYETEIEFVSPQYGADENEEYAGVVVVCDELTNPCYCCDKFEEIGGFYMIIEFDGVEPEIGFCDLDIIKVGGDDVISAANTGQTTY